MGRAERKVEEVKDRTAGIGRRETCVVYDRKGQGNWGRGERGNGMKENL